MGILLALFGLYAVTATLLLGSACPIRLIFGVPCPSCGMTRAHLLFFTFHFEEAFEMHPLFLFSIPTLAIVLIGTAKPKYVSSKPVIILAALMIAALIICYVVRMILYFPHTEPFDYNYNSLLGLIITAAGGAGNDAAGLEFFAITSHFINNGKNPS